MKQLRTAQTSPDHLLTSLMEKKNTRSNESSHTDNSADQNGYSISSNGRDTPKATTRGNQLTRFMPLILSSIINPQEPISHPQPTFSQQLEKHISQHHLDHIQKPSKFHPISLSNAQRSSPFPNQTPPKRLPYQRPYTSQTLRIRLRPLGTPLSQHLLFPLQTQHRPRINTSLVL